MTTIKIFLVEDDPDWIRAMTAYLNSEPDLEVAGYATEKRLRRRASWTLTLCCWIFS